MGNYSFLAIISFLSCTTSLLSDWLQEGKVINIISGNTFRYQTRSDKKIKIYQIPCTKASLSESLKGKNEIQILKNIIFKKKFTGIIRGKLDNGVILLDVLLIKKRNKKDYYISLRRFLVNNKILQKTYESSECWPEEE